MKYAYNAYITAIFEMDGDNNDAQAWVLSKLEPLGTISRIEITKWIDVHRNEPTKMVRAEGEFYKYSLDVNLLLFSDGGYADAQKVIVDALKGDEAASHMNINRVLLTRSLNEV